MKNSKLLPLIITASIFTTSCENMSPGENAAVFGGAAAAVTGGVLALAGVDPRIVIPVAAGAALLAGGMAFVVSKQQATARQRQIALQNARAAEARLLAQQRAASKPSTTSSTGRTVAKKAPAKSVPRYLAVDTVAQSQSPAQTKQQMVYDTETRKLVGNTVYNVKRTPSPGSSVKYDTMTAKYVGQ
jgi:type II secretory pathway pseudopilin PulG